MDLSQAYKKILKNFERSVLKNKIEVFDIHSFTESNQKYTMKQLIESQKKFSQIEKSD